MRDAESGVVYLGGRLVGSLSSRQTTHHQRVTMQDVARPDAHACKCASCRVVPHFLRVFKRHTYAWHLSQVVEKKLFKKYVCVCLRN